MINDLPPNALIIEFCLWKPVLIFNLMSSATATVSAAKKTWIFKRKMAVMAGNTRGSLAAVNNYCHQASRWFQSVSVSSLPFSF